MTSSILVIDDSEDDQRLYQRAFKDFDSSFTLTMTPTAEAGFARIADARPDLILLDYNLPDMDGLSFMKMLRENSDAHIPIIMLTGEGSTRVAVEAMKHGADDYLIKDTEGRYLRLLPGVLGRVVAAYAQREEAQLLRRETQSLLSRKQMLMQNSMDGIHVLDMQGDVVESNDAFGRMLGYSQEEVACLNVTDWTVEFSSQELQARFQDHIGKSLMVETVHRRKDGSLINVEISVTGEEIEGQGLLFCSSRDITERKKSEVALHRSEANLRAMLDNSPYLTWLKDPDGRYITINKVFADQLKLEDPRQAIGKTDLDFQPKELAEKYRADDAEVMATRQRSHVEEEGFDGNKRYWAESYKTPIIDAHGNVLGTVGFAKDITERKRNEVLLRESQQKLKLFIEGAPTGIAAFDTEMRYLAVSEQFLKQFHVVDTDVIGRSHYEIFPEIPERWRDIHRRCLAGETLSCNEDPFQRADGSVDWVRWEIRPWFDTSGKIGGILCFTDDVSERMRFEQELIVLNNQLTHEVSKRTSDLSALTAHVQQITEAERARLARELHDELGSVLVGLSMEVWRLKEKVSDPDLLQDLSVIKDLLSNATQIKQNVVSQLYPTGLDTHGFIASVEWLVNEYRKHSGIAVELVVPEEDIVMEHTFALAAYRITQECLTNIAKHAEASKVHIEAKAIDGFIDLTIHDNGKGAAELNNTGGHGIFGMIERARYLGGSMEFRSEAKKGMTAHLHIPMAAAKPNNRKKVLVVDDHAIVRDALRQLLDTQTDDFSVAGEAADGKAAIQMAINGVWDIMLLDITLPKKNGLKVLEEVMAIKSNLPIIMLSSHAEEEYGEIALSKGAAGYIEKGETSKLVEAMRRATLRK